MSRLCLFSRMRSDIPVGPGFLEASVCLAPDPHGRPSLEFSDILLFCWGWGEGRPGGVCGGRGSVGGERRDATLTGWGMRSPS